MTPADASIQSEILAQLRNLGERLATVEADLKTVIGAHANDLSDHENRLRTLEATSRNAVTQGDLDRLEAKRTKQVADALAEADRKRNRGTAYVVAAIAAVNTAIAVFTALH